MDDFLTRTVIRTLAMYSCGLSGTMSSTLANLPALQYVVCLALDFFMA